MLCGNCPNSAVLNNRFLSRHYGMMKVITELRFVCRRCRSQRYRLRLVPDHLAKKSRFGCSGFAAYMKSIWTDEQKQRTNTATPLAPLLPGAAAKVQLTILLTKATPKAAAGLFRSPGAADRRTRHTTGDGSLGSSIS